MHRASDLTLMQTSLLRAWKPLAGGLAVVGGSAYYLTRPSTFDLPIKVAGPDGKAQMSTRTLPLLPMQTINERLRKDSTSETVSRPDGITWRYTTASLPSNDPIEDAHSHQIIERDDALASGDYLFFNVFDGHRGPETSRLLSRVLIDAVALELTQLANSTGALNSKSFTSKLFGSSTSSSQPDIASTIEKAFTKLDSLLMDAPVTILQNHLKERSSKDLTIPDLSKDVQGMSAMQAAISGSCALMALFDTAQRNLYVALTGDCRAVAGVWEPTANGKGAWKVDVLTEDQTARNPSEVKRIQSEHPPEEAEYVVKNGRVLGGLEPSRAFGDARYKWTARAQGLLNQVYMIGNGTPLRKAPLTLKTPPYVTAKPVVTRRTVDFENPASLRFLVIATDGLWDALSSEDVVSLVGGHLAGLKGTIPKEQLPSLVPTSTANAGLDGKPHIQKKKDGGSWAFVDDNVSTHLIRNALGGGDEMALRRMMSIPAPYSRRYRDDITVKVIWWEHGKEDQATVTSFSPSDPVKSKL
ncbi:hypothetical protein D9758_004843 [Tetrapyrgos nigripes]|uniref:PPM-type phosphatase domain-containing protein n=1 Tax=Tetrapyrgos nigripes TaxID=182062 RepID=A0A8H5LJ22_9AGAR|nr:hypothetical protein D9758_004843 [Tetrapyrgos nigripes]